MTVAENRELVRRYFAAFGAGELDAACALLAPDYQAHTHDTRRGSDAEGTRERLQLLLDTFGEPELVIEDMRAEGDRVATRWVLHGTHRHPFLGIPASGRRVSFRGVDFHRLAGGSIAEEWALRDRLSLLRQLTGEQLADQPASTS